MKNHLLAAVALSGVTLAAAALAGASRSPALAGAAIAVATGLASLWAYGRPALAARKPVQWALLVFVVTFLVRIALIAVALALLVRAGHAVVPFVVAFFVPYFAFTVIEGWLLASLGRTSGKPA